MAATFSPAANFYIQLLAIDVFSMPPSTRNSDIKWETFQQLISDDKPSLPVVSFQKYRA